MSKRTMWLVVAAGLGLIVLAACTPAAVEVTREVEVTRVIEVTPAFKVPFEAAWQGSGHADVAGEPFRHWDDATANPDGVPTSCARCHTSAGYADYIADGKVDAAVPAAEAQGIVCETCHSAAAAALTSVTFPSGLVGEGLGPEARCMQCHQGRESKVSVDKQINETFAVTDVDAVVAPIKDASGKDVRFGFRNVHYFAAGGTLYGSQAQMGYEYEGKDYDPKFRHVAGIETCLGCHNQHTLEVKIEVCQECHEGVTSVEDMKNARMNGSLEDYNGNGDTTEGIYSELAGLQEILYGSIKAYAKEVAGTGIVYDAAAYPYWFADADGDGKIDQADGKNVGYSTWTARLLKAAYNYQVSVKDPGAFAHNAKYIIELLYDSIEDLNGKIATPVDMGSLHRNDAGHFAGNTEPFRHWDEEGEVAAGCAKCHSATGLPQFIHNKGTTYLTSTGTLGITGIVGQPPANGFMCTTCHDEANWPNRYAVTNVPFPSGATLTFSTKDADGKLVPVDANLCIECHQGRESTASVNAAVAGIGSDEVKLKADGKTPALSFKNIHYFAAGATLFGDAAKGAYQYTGKTYAGQNTEHPLNQCTQCHEVHELTVQVDACKGCHTNVKGEEDLQNIRMSTVDYDGDGNTAEGIYGEIDTMRAALYAAIQAYSDAQGQQIMYSGSAYPYFFADADKDGKADKTADNKNVAINWTPRLLEAAYNLQYSYKDPGAFAHNPMYVMQFLYDSIEDLDKAGVAGMTRP